MRRMQTPVRPAAHEDNPDSFSDRFRGEIAAQQSFVGGGISAPRRPRFARQLPFLYFSLLAGLKIATTDPNQQSYI